MPKIIKADCREALQDMIDEKCLVNTILTDPPYHLESIVKRFGKEGSAAAKHGSDGRFTRASKGFMGRTWDGADSSGKQIAHDPELWRLCHDVLLPGGMIVAFSSPKTGHRMACAMEDAGLIIHPFIAWLYAQGFPKAHAVGDDWPGWYHGGQAMNPACDPIYVAQRPRSEKTNARNMARHETGAFNIEASRVFPERITPQATFDMIDGVAFEAPRSNGKGVNSRQDSDLARWPSNVLHDGSPDACGAFPIDAKGSKARYFNAFPPALFHPKAAKAEKIGGHPTQKPIGLLRWLAVLTTAPGGIILDPFAGTGTTGMAAEAEGFDAILIEREIEYVKVIRSRFKDRASVDLLG